MEYSVLFNQINIKCVLYHKNVLVNVLLSTISPLLAENILYYSYWFKWAFMDVTFNFLEENILQEPDIDKLM